MRAAMRSSGSNGARTETSCPPASYFEPLALAGALSADGLPAVAGVHLEGPFLSPAWAGAHDPACLLHPDPALAGRLCAAGPVTMVTVAPELPGGLELVRRLAGG